MKKLIIGLILTVLTILPFTVHAGFFGGGGGTTLPPCENGQVLVYNTTTSAWDTCASLAGGGDMLEASYVTAGKIKAAAGGTGIDTSASSGFPYTSSGTWSVINAATARTNMGVAIGTNVQAYDADLDYLAGFTPSDNVKTILNAANNAAIKTALGYYTSGDAITGSLTGNASTATALAANGANCSAGQYPLGVNASGAVEDCTAAPTASSLHMDDILTALGIASEAVNLGAFTGSTIADNQTVKAALQSLETAFEGLPGGHTQNTDTGTTRTTFLIDSGNTGVRVKHNTLALEARNAADDAYANFRAATITASGFSGPLTGAVTGNASTASALAANPADCASNQFASSIAANGDLTCSSIPNAATTAASTNTASAIVTRDGSGNFAAGTITAALSGNASTATALASDPSDCAAGAFATAIAANGNLTCGASWASPSAIGTSTPAAATFTTLNGGGQTGTCNSTITQGFCFDADGDFFVKSVNTIRVAGQASATDMYEIPANGNSKVTLKAPDSLAADYTATLPSETGTLCSTGSVCTGYQASITRPVTGPASPTAGLLTKWNTSGQDLVDAFKYGTLTDGKWCSFSTANGLTCAQDTPAGAGDVTGGSASGAGELAAYTDTSGKAITRSYVAFSGPSTSVKTKTASNANDTIAELGQANNFSVGQTISAVNAASGSATAATLSGTLGIFNGSDTFRALYLNYTNSNHTGTGNTVALIDVPAISGDANSNFYGLRFGNFTGTSGAAGEVEQAINVGTGFDHGLYSKSPVYIGDDTNGLTISASGAMTAAGTASIPAASLLIASQAAGDTLYASSSTAWSRLAKGAAYSLKRMNSGATAPEWSTATIDDSTANVTKLANGTSSLQIKAGQALNFTGTFTDGKLCTYTASGSVIACNTDAAGGGNVSNSGTPTAGQIATWVNATTITGTAAPTGLTSVSFGADPADSGAVRLSNNTAVAWEQSSPGTDIFVALDDSNIFHVGQNAATISIGTSGTGNTTVVGDLTITGNDIIVGSATNGARITGGNGLITFKGEGDGTDEDLTINLNSSNVATVSSSTGVTDISLSALNLATTGSIAGGIPITSDNNGMSSAEMTSAGMYGRMYLATGAGTWALPGAATGMNFCIYSTTAAAIVINPDNGDTITLNGTALSAGDSITSASGAGDFICLLAVSADSWITLGRSGTWTDTN